MLQKRVYLQQKPATADFVASDYTPDGGNTTIDDTPAYKKAASREAAVGEAAERTAAELGNGSFSRL